MTCGPNHWLGDDKVILEREIEVVQTLLAEQPDSKCECPCPAL
jgi:hypothetical protein